MLSNSDQKIKSKDPSTFCFYGSAQQYYKDSAYNIINYYPFDGTKEEIMTGTFLRRSSTQRF